MTWHLNDFMCHQQNRMLRWPSPKPFRNCVVGTKRLKKSGVRSWTSSRASHFYVACWYGKQKFGHFPDCHMLFYLPHRYWCTPIVHRDGNLGKWSTGCLGKFWTLAITPKLLYWAVWLIPHMIPPIGTPIPQYKPTFQICQVDFYFRKTQKFGFIWNLQFLDCD